MKVNLLESHQGYEGERKVCYARKEREDNCLDAAWPSDSLV